MIYNDSYHDSEVVVKKKKRTVDETISFEELLDQAKKKIVNLTQTAATSVTEICDMTSAEYDDLISSEKLKGKHIMWRNEKAYIYELPLYKHEFATSVFNLAVGNTPHLISVSSPTVSTPAWGAEPDAAYFAFRSLPHGVVPAANRDAKGDVFPNVVVEVGVSESISDLHADAVRWLGPATEVQMVILIKLWKNDKGMLLMIFVRGNVNPINVISFGTKNLHYTANAPLNAARGTTPVTGVIPGGVACNALGLAAFQLSLPIAHFYHRDPNGVPVGQGNIIIDLFDVQQTILAVS